MAELLHLSILILVLCLFVHSVEARGPIMRFHSQFELWYPQFGETFKELLDTKCQSEYQQYLYGTLGNTTIDWVRGADENNLFTQPVIECILDETSEYIKSSLSSAQIILGLTPTVLALIGASSEESALMAVIGKRPFLTFLLSVSSPSVHLTRAFEYRDPQEVLHGPRGRHEHKLGNPRPTLLSSRLFVFGEYMLVLASLFNVGFVNWDLSRRAPCTLFSELTFMPALWAVIVVFIHATGVGVLRLRVRRTTELHDEPPTKWPWDWVRRRMASEFRKGWSREFCTVAYQDGGKIFVDWFPETRLFIGLTWFLSIGNVVHIVFGTLVFSGMTFVGPRDALQIFGRYMASALACRVILTHELAGLKDAYNAGLDVEAEGSEHWRMIRCDPVANGASRAAEDTCGGIRAYLPSGKTMVSATEWFAENEAANMQLAHSSHRKGNMIVITNWRAARASSSESPTRPLHGIWRLCSLKWSSDPDLAWFTTRCPIWACFLHLNSASDPHMSGEVVW